MKSLTRTFLLALALTLATWVHAQTFEQSYAAYERKDYSTALEGFKKLADQGNASAQTTLGFMYATEQGVSKDEQLAVAWFRKAADQGYARAQSNLGLMYQDGRGVSKDEQLAVAWFRKAAEQGYDGAQYSLGLMHFKGEGVSKDEESAYFWWLLASAQGHQNAAKGRDILEPRLSPEQRTAAQASARNWQAKAAAQAANALAQQNQVRLTQSVPLTEPARKEGSSLKDWLGVLNDLAGVVNSFNAGRRGESYSNSLEPSPLLTTPQSQPQPQPQPKTMQGTSGYQTRDSFGNLVNSRDSYQTKDSFGNLVNSRDSFQTRDSFGNLVNSKNCFQTKDSFGNLVRSGGC